MSRENLQGWDNSSVHDVVAFPEDLRRLEVEELKARRRIWGNVGSATPTETGPIGFALSGGGIRSATFSLGLFQALARAGGLGRVDYLSTVSGGGYFGGFLGRMFHNKLAGTAPSRQQIPHTPSSPDEVRTAARAADQCAIALSSSESTEVAWLRDNGRYLAPGGSGDLWVGTATAVRNWAAVLYVLGLAALTLFLWARLPWALIPQTLTATLLEPLVRHGGAFVVWSAWVWAPLVVFALLCFPFGWVYFLVFPREVQGVARYVPPGTAPAAAISTAAVFLLALAAGPGLTMILGLPRLEELGWIRELRLLFDDAGLRLVGIQFLGWALLAACVVVAITWVYALHRFEFLTLTRLRQKVRGSTAPKAEPESTTQARMDEAHGWLSRKLSRTLTVVAALVLLALLDTAGGTVYSHLHANPKVLWSGVVTVASVLAGLVSFGSRAAARLSDGKGSGRLPLPWKAVAAVVAGLVLFVLLTAVATIAHGFCWGFGPPNPTLAGATDHPVFELRAVGGELIRVAPVQVASPDDEEGRRTPWLVTFSALAMLLFSLLLGRIVPFLNYSSLHTLYGGRLARAYLGASNPDRVPPPGGQAAPVLEDDPGDDLPMASYRPSAAGGPIHLVNVTINETVSPKTGLAAGDQRGLGMTVSPNALSVGVKHHVLRLLPGQRRGVVPAKDVAAGGVSVFPPDGFRIFEYRQPSAEPEKDPSGAETEPYGGEPLTLGQWIAISGAAFSTGIGSKTSLGASLLCGLANVRLGYWWDSGVDPAHRKEATGLSRWRRRGIGLATDLPVFSHLADEWFARFHGTNRQRWNLSDGGHFNNLGAYELVRRRLPLVVVVDAEADPDNTFDALTDFVRRIRVDLCAETRFLTHEEMAPLFEGAPPEWRHVLGVLSDLGRLPPEATTPMTQLDQSMPQDVWRRADPEARRRSKAHATLAEIAYFDRTTGRPTAARSLMLYVKASLTGDERADVLQYQQDHLDFPHETTADQFFDDSQWESYRKLGEHVGGLVFNCPFHLKPGSPAPPLPDLLAPLAWLWSTPPPAPTPGADRRQP